MSMVMRRSGLFSRTALVLGLVFLYVPIASMIVYSFNNSRLVTVWDAAHSPTLKWYRVLFSDGEVLDAAWLSLRVALCAATASTVLGTLAGTALARFGAFRGRSLLVGMTTAPIVMPEVISGLSLLLLFVALEQVIGWPHGMGAMTITLAHISFCMAYVAVVIQSRLAGFDESLEEAAQDLGARPAKVFWRITLPLILPAVLAGWLLAFTLSWDDLVISQFVAGPGSSTLPMVIFSKVRLGVSPDVNALATLMVSVVASGVVVATVWMRHRQKRRERDTQLAAAANL
jgi:putrescine transport system permease protein